MKKFLKPYAPYAKALLGIAGVALVGLGIYDAATAQAAIGAALAGGSAFWVWYDKYIGL